MAAHNVEVEVISKQLAQQVEELSINNDTLITCANCGKEGNNLNICNKCKAATIVMPPVKRSIDQNINKTVKGVLLSYMMKNLSAKDEQRSCMMRSYSKSLCRMKIVPSACYLYHHFIQVGSTDHAAGKGFAVDAFMQSK